MTRFPYSRGTRIFGYLHFAQPLLNRVRARARQVAEHNGTHIEGRCIKHSIVEGNISDG